MTVQQVSFDSERLILVASDDSVTGHASKRMAHLGSGLLHRAFSIFLFSPAGKVLLHRRSDSKPLWPGYWTNSCCSHPREGEPYDHATRRRLSEELGLEASLQRLYRFEYQAQYGDAGTEHELCTVYVGCIAESAPVSCNPLEIAAWGWFDIQEVDELVAADSSAFTPWFLLEWARLRSDFSTAVAACCQGPALAG